MSSTKLTESIGSNTDTHELEWGVKGGTSSRVIPTLKVKKGPNLHTRHDVKDSQTKKTKLGLNNKPIQYRSELRARWRSAAAITAAISPLFYIPDESRVPASVADYTVLPPQLLTRSTNFSFQDRRRSCQGEDDRSFVRSFDRSTDRQLGHRHEPSFDAD